MQDPRPSESYMLLRPSGIWCAHDRVQGRFVEVVLPGIFLFPIYLPALPNEMKRM